MKQKLDRGAWLTLAAAILMVVWGGVGTFLFFSLPTDGWLVVDPPADEGGGLIFLENIAGTSSGLQAGDRVTAVEGISLDLEDLSALADRWQAGSSLRYSLLRDHSALVVSVPLVKWSFTAAVQFFIGPNGEIGGLLGQLLFLVISAIAFFKRPAESAARTLFLLAVMVMSVGTVVNLFLSNLAAHIDPQAQFISFFSIAAAFTFLLPPCLLRLALVFPRPKPVLLQYPFLGYLPFMVGLVVFPLFLFTNGAAGWLWTIFTAFATTAILIHSAFTVKDTLSRAQLVWGLWGMILSLILFFSSYLVKFGVVGGVLADFVTFLSNIGLGVLGATLSMAILRYRLFEISFIIRRTLLYTALMALLGLVYTGGVLVLQQVFRAITGQESDLALVISTLLIAGLFSPLRRRIQHFINRRFFRGEYNAGHALDRFSQNLRGRVDLAGIETELVEVVTQTIQPSRVSFWIREVKK